MNPERVQNIFIAFIAVALVVTGLAVYAQSQQVLILSGAIRSLSKDVKTLKQQTTPPGQKPTTSSNEVSRQTVSYSGAIYTFVNLCEGEVQQAPQYPGVPIAPPKICLGKNVLSYRNASGQEQALVTTVVTNPADALLLMDAFLIPSSKGYGNVLLSYSAEPCYTVDDCGVGMPDNYVKYVFDLATERLRTLVNYPTNGKALWNSSGTKAVFIQPSCGGAGCDERPLLGYNLTNDDVKLLGSNAAASQSNAEDIEGNKLAYWERVSWKDDDIILATIVSSSGARQTITINF